VAAAKSWRIMAMPKATKAIGVKRRNVINENVNVNHQYEEILRNEINKSMKKISAISAIQRK
jgi:hypothetical protein